MTTRGWGILAFVLALVIIVLAWFLFTTPAHAPVTAPQATSTNETILPIPTSTGSSTTQIVVTTPAPNATVSHTFEVAGIAPNQWFFEAVFPMQVRDTNGNLIGSSQAQAQGDWTQQGPVTFTSQMTVDASYEGSATLVLSKDNPSGLTQNDDSVTVPIVIR